MPVVMIAASNSASPALSQADEEEFKLETTKKQSNMKEVKQVETDQ